MSKKQNKRKERFKKNALNYSETIKELGTNSDLNEASLKKLYKKNGVIRNIVDSPAEDATREGFEIIIEDDNDGKIQELLYIELKKIDLQEITKKMMQYDHLVGGSIAYFRTKGSKEKEDEMTLDNMTSLEKIQVFPKDKVVKVVKEEDLKSEDYDEIKKIEVKTSSGEESIHSSRIYIYSPRKFLDENFGDSILETVYEPINLLYNFYWSAGQVAYAMTFKVLKSAGIDLSDLEAWKKIQAMIEEELNTTTTAVIGKEDSLEQHGAGGKIPDLKAMGDVFWEYLSACSRIPVAILKGNQMGKLSGAEYDAINYFNRISGLQETALRPFHERVIRMKLKELGYKDKSFQLIYSSLWKLDEKTVAEIRKLNTESDKNEATTVQTLMLSGAVTAKDLKEIASKIMGSSLKMNSKENKRSEISKKIIEKIIGSG